MSLGKKIGILYLLVAVLAPFTMLYVPSLLFVPDDIISTVNNIANNEMLFRASIAIGTVVCIIEIVLTAFIYRLFKSVNRTLSLAAAFARLSMVTIQGINIIFRLLTIAPNNSEISQLLGEKGVAAFTALMIDAHDFGVYAWQLFFGLHLIILGSLILKSDFIPKLFGYLILISSLGYLADSYVGILLPTNSFAATIVSGLLLISTVGEVTFMLWLLFRGNNIKVDMSG